MYRYSQDWVRSSPLTWLQILWCRNYTRRRHRAFHKDLKPESNAHKQDPRLFREVGDLWVAILTNQIGLL